VHDNLLIFILYLFPPKANTQMCVPIYAKVVFVDCATYASLITSQTHVSGQTYWVPDFYQDSKVLLHTAAFMKKQIIASQNSRQQLKVISWKIL
jgi:hypothetical protein